MKMIEWALIGALLVLPFFVANRLDTEAQRKTLVTELRYDAALDTAVDDAARALLIHANPQQDVQYESAKSVPVNKEEAMETFQRTLYMNFGIADDPIAQGMLDRYIPAVVVIDYDGFWVYSEEEIRNNSGETELRRVWGTKKPFAYRDAQGNSLAFTLDDRVKAYVASIGSWHEGLRSDIQASTPVPLLQDTDRFEQVRRSTIVNAIQNELAYRINRYNQMTARIGVAYTFTLPTISQEEWNNSIDDVGIMAFMQGIPIGHKTYNNYALGGSRLLKRTSIVGALKGNMKVYYRSSCSFPYPVEETFPNEKAATQKGYRPLSCENQG